MSRIGLDGDAVDVHHAGNLEVVINLQQPPEADAVAVFVPAPVGNVGHRRAAGRRGQDRARHGLRRVPFLDIGDGPHHHARALRQLQRLALDDRRIGDAIVRQHADGGLGEIHRRPCICCRPIFRTAEANRLRARASRVRRGVLAPIPVENLRAVPVQHALVLVDVFVDGFEIFDPVRLPADVGVDGERDEFRASWRSRHRAGRTGR